MHSRMQSSVYHSLAVKLAHLQMSGRQDLNWHSITGNSQACMLCAMTSIWTLLFVMVPPLLGMLGLQVCEAGLQIAKDSLRSCIDLCNCFHRH